MEKPHNVGVYIYWVIVLRIYCGEIWVSHKPSRKFSIFVNGIVSYAQFILYVPALIMCTIKLELGIWVSGNSGLSARDVISLANDRLILI
jgi:hypothetical protein